jgi:hypothetical protein
LRLVLVFGGFVGASVRQPRGAAPEAGVKMKANAR